MINARFYKFGKILDAADATGVGITFDVREYRNCVVTIAGANSSNLTVKCQGSLGIEDTSVNAQITAPTFSSAQSVTNPWDYTQIVDLEDGSSIDGDTGVAFSGSNDVRNFEVNINNLNFINFNVTARSAGDVTVWCMCTTNA